MRFARYWSRAYVNLDGVEDPDNGVPGLGWSDDNADHAHRVAVERARRAAAALRAEEPVADWDYPYPDRPVREPVVDELMDGDRVIAAITRNAYGSLVLNTADVMFIDIDAPTGVSGLIGSLLGGSDAAGKLIRKTAARLNELADTDGRLGFRLYRTAAGLRVMVIGRTFDPASKESSEMMVRMKADKRYTLLCSLQACFRARLTPKPWRCGIERSPGVFPYEDAQRQDEFEAWLKRYERAANDYAVCELIAEVGSQTVGEDIRPILTWHDELVCRDGLPLA